MGPREKGLAILVVSQARSARDCSLHLLVSCENLRVFFPVVTEKVRNDVDEQLFRPLFARTAEQENAACCLLVFLHQSFLFLSFPPTRGEITPMPPSPHISVVLALHPSSVTGETVRALRGRRRREGGVEGSRATRRRRRRRTSRQRVGRPSERVAQAVDFEVVLDHIH